MFRFGRDMPVTFPKWCNTGIVRYKGLRHELTDKGIEWSLDKVNELPYYNHIEMTGLKVSGIISYGADENGLLRMHRHVVYPTLRMLPNDTRGNLTHNFDSSLYNEIYVDGVLVKEYLKRVVIEDGLTLISETLDGLFIQRILKPSMTEKSLIETVRIINHSDESKYINGRVKTNFEETKKEESANGSYILEVLSSNVDMILKPGDFAEIIFLSTAREREEVIDINRLSDLSKRKNFESEMLNNMVIKTPDSMINMACHMTKKRFAESIIETKRGYMHAPGGGDYYAALWTNDQCEYTNPIFPYLGYDIGIEQSMNAYRLFMTYMNDFDKPLVSSIVAEGDDYWDGAGDRGDAAMFAYGASRFALTLGNQAYAKELLEGIKWCLEFSLRKKNSEGVIESDSDELENRFESGDANLFTSCLVYDALISTYYLSKSLKIGEERYLKEAEALKSSIESYFGAHIKGFDTYRYCKDYDVLRSWICMPLVVDIFDRKEGTVSALLSDYLWTEDGLKTEEYNETFWDRSTLFALRGLFKAGKQELGEKYLKAYTERRLLGEHVPYPVEAFPEGNQRHLAGESALYNRIFLEGILGMRPVGFGEMVIRPQLPKSWSYITFENIHINQKIYNITVKKQDNYTIKITQQEDIIYESTVEFDNQLYINLNNEEAVWLK